MFSYYMQTMVQMITLCCVFLAPLVSLRTLSMLGPLSNVAVAVAGAFVASVLSLTGIAVATGKVGRAYWFGMQIPRVLMCRMDYFLQIGDFHWLPNPDTLGSSPTAIALNIIGILPVVTMSFVCHYNILPIVRGTPHTPSSC
jgi:amino acid permease